MINLFFVIHDHSGARTYANELLGYLSGQEGIAVHKVYLNSGYYNEYSIIDENKITSIHIPKVKSKKGTLDKLAMRCTDLIAPFIHGMENLVFHLNYSTQVRFGMEVRKRFGAKLVYTMHFLPNYFSYIEVDPGITEELVTTGDVLDKEILKEADKVICISKFAKGAICNQYKTPTSKTRVIYNGHGKLENNILSGNIEGIKESFGFEESERIILYAGRLSEDKGVYALINVFKKIHKEFPGTRLVLAGDGEFRELFPLCKEMSGKVSFLGNLGMNELQKLYSIAEIGVCPSFFELLGYTPIEMMANQLPVVISDVPGMRELVEDGVDGLACGVRKRKDGLLGLEVDEESLYVKMRLLIKDKALAKKLALNGRKKWETQFTAEHMGQETYRLYQDVLSIGKKELQPVSKFDNLTL